MKKFIFLEEDFGKYTVLEISKFVCLQMLRVVCASSVPGFLFSEVYENRCFIVNATKQENIASVRFL